MGLLQVVVYAAASKVDTQSNAEETAPPSDAPSGNETTNDIQKDPHVLGIESNPLGQSTSSKSDGQRSIRTYDIFLLMPQSDLSNLCGLLGHEGYFSHSLYLLLSYK